MYLKEWKILRAIVWFVVIADAILVALSMHFGQFNERGSIWLYLVIAVTSILPISLIVLQHMSNKKAPRL